MMTFSFDNYDYLIQQQKNINNNNIEEMTIFI